MTHSLIVFLLATVMALATVPAPQTQQKSPPQEEKAECGTTIPPEQIKAELARKTELARENSAPLALALHVENALYLPLTIHMVCDKYGIGGLSTEQLEAAMESLNQTWRPAYIQFFIYGEIDYSIQNDDFYIMPNVDARQDALRQVNNVPNTINIYFTHLQGIAGQARFTTETAQGILLDYSTMSGNSSGFFGLEVFAHEMGHYFDLYHTHATNFGVECPSGSNCSTTGDLLCDTPADPGLFNPVRVDGNCVYDNSAALPANCDNTPYKPSTRNLMSVARGTCRNEFTTDQINKAWQVLYSASNRKNLPDTGKFFVDPQASNSNTKCTASAPCKTVEKAMQAAQNGALIFLKARAHSASSISGKAVTIKRWGNEGLVTIRP